jgi:PAS domain S-box-containing protein
MHGSPDLKVQHLPLHMLKRLLRPPSFGDSVAQQAARTLYYTQITIIAAAILAFCVSLATTMAAVTLISILITACLALISAWLLRRQHLILSGSLLLLSLLCLAGIMLVSDEGGLHDVAIMIYPGVILIAGLTLNRRLLVLFTSLSILSIAVVAYLESAGRLDTFFTRFGYADTLLDALVAAIILTTTAIFTALFVESYIQNYAHLEQHEKALRETNERLQLALNAAGLGEWEYDISTSLFEHSAFFDLLTGDPEHEIRLDFIHPDDQRAVQTALDTVATGEADRFELSHRILHQDGSERWARTWGRLVRDKAGKPAKITGLSQDITESKRAEAALQESEALYRKAIEAAGAVPYFLDYTKQAYAFMGAGIEAITGYTAEEMTPDLYNNTLVQYGILIGEAALYPFDEAVQKARNGEITIWRTDNLIRTRGGDLRWLLDSAIQVRNARGKIYGSIGILQDITERKLAENEIRKLNADLEQLVENRTYELEISKDRLSQALRLANMAYWEYNIAAQYFSLNDPLYDVLRTTAASAGGYHLDFTEFLNRFVHPEDRSQMRTWFQSVLSPDPKNGVANQFEYRAIGGDGEVQYVLVDFQVIENEQGEPSLAYGYHMDITHRKMAEAALAQRSQQLENANRELESFAYTISHDLRAPLRAVQGYSRILDEDYASQLSPDARLCLNNINAGAERMSRLIDDLLEFSRLGRQPIRRVTVQPNMIIHQVIEELKPEYQNRAVRFDVAELPSCQADPALLHLVYENLLSNALKYSRERNPAEIRIDSQKQEHETIYSVSDNGIGFDMSYAQNIFGVFQRLHSEDQYEGTGIGLATVQRIIHRHGGRIWFTAEIDKGATFYFTLGPKD